jgi:hypothetical protein
LVTEKPSMVTLAAWTVNVAWPGITPATLDSAGLKKVRPLKWLPACAPLRVRNLGIVTFSKYTPGATLTGLQPGSLTADCIVG